ncbi:hypothetical protein ACU4GD_19630 [Cupriavidus basilensis]
MTIYSGELKLIDRLRAQFGYAGDEAGAPAWLQGKQAELDRARQQTAASGEPATRRDLQREYGLAGPAAPGQPGCASASAATTAWACISTRQAWTRGGASRRCRPSSSAPTCAMCTTPSSRHPAANSTRRAAPREGSYLRGPRSYRHAVSDA